MLVGADWADNLAGEATNTQHISTSDIAQVEEIPETQFINIDILNSDDQDTLTYDTSQVEVKETEKEKEKKLTDADEQSNSKF